MTAILRVLVLLGTGPLVLPAAWCCIVMAATVAETTEAADSKDCCRGCCGGEEAPCTPERPAPPSPRACCPDRDVLPPDGPRLPDTPLLSPSLRPVEGSVTLAAHTDREEEWRPPFSRPLHLLECVWRC